MTSWGGGMGRERKRKKERMNLGRQVLRGEEILSKGEAAVLNEGNVCHFPEARGKKVQLKVSVCAGDMV